MFVWENEPDEWHGTFYGFPVRAQRHPELKTWCGYVRVGNDHPWAGLTYDEVHRRWDVRVHGRLTYSKDDEFGFDCAHAWDFAPGVAPWPKGAVYRTLSYVIAELVGLARQAQMARS